jgi:tetratricopeptide (TPR) repeat protein
MSFLEEFDRHSNGENLPDSKNSEILEFAELVRSRKAAPSDEERERVLARVREAEARARTGEQIGGNSFPRGLRRSRWYLTRLITAAAAVMLCVGLLAWLRGDSSGEIAGSGGGEQILDPSTTVLVPRVEPGSLGRVTDTPEVPVPVDKFASILFPKPKADAGKGAAKVEAVRNADRARLLRTGGLVMIRRKGQKRWRVAGRGDELAAGDWLRASKRLNSGARLLAPEGSRVSLAWGAELRYDGTRKWHLAKGRAYFDVARRKDRGRFIVTTPDGRAEALGTEFLVSVVKFGKEKKPATFCWVDKGRVALSGAKSGKPLVLAKGKSGRLLAGSALPSKKLDDLDWLDVLEAKSGADHGIGELLARAVGEKTATMQPLEIRSHDVTVTVVDQVARTFIDEVFVNNTYRQMEGVFYYSLPPGAAVSEFAMYVNGKRVEGEVLEQKRARQIFEYIRRQRRDPALLEWAGGNLFKMRIYPIEPRSTKRIQLGYTQVLPRRKGKVTYSYPLVSEKLLKNPLHALSIRFQVLSSFGLENLKSPSHKVALAMGEKGMTGALAFGAREYSPTRDFSVTYDVPNAPECAVFGNAPREQKGNYFMAQLCPQAQISSPKVAERIIVIVDGSASSSPQDYSVASEFAAAVADMTLGWKYGVLRGGQKPEFFGAGMLTSDVDTSAKIRSWLKARPPLGATDLVASFKAAAKVIGPRDRVKIVYVGDGIETLGEKEGTALAEALAAVFEGKHVEVSCAAVGSSYDQLVLGKLAALTGGSFVRVEGTANLHASVDRIIDSFYQANIRDVSVVVEGLEASDLYPNGPVVVAEGDTLVVLGKAGKTGRGTIILSGRTEAGAFRKRYAINLQADPASNRFLPRLWAKAHIDALFAKMGLDGQSEDSRLRKQIIGNSVHYQIMSPFTAFLVLENEKHFKEFGIKRRKKMWDWHGGIDEISSTTRHGGKVGSKGETGARGQMPKLEPLVEYKKSAAKPGWDPMPLMPVRKALRSRERDGRDRFENLKSEAIRDWVGEKLGKPSERYDRFETEEVRKGYGYRARGGEDAISDIPLGGFTYALPMSGEFLTSGRRREKGRRRSINPYYYRPIPRVVYSSPLLASGKVVGLRIDKPLRSSTVYRRLVASGKARLADRLNLALALGREGKFSAAVKALGPVLVKMPEVPGLWVELGTLKLRAGNRKGANAAFKKALELTPEKDRPALRARLGGLLAGAAEYLRAAQCFEHAATNATADLSVAQWGALAASYYQNAGQAARGRGLWSVLVKKWPKSGAVLAAAGNWHLSYGTDAARAIELLREARGRGAECGASLVSALRSAGGSQEAIIEARIISNSSKSPGEIQGAMNQLVQLSPAFARREVARLLRAGSSRAQRLAATTLMLYNAQMRTKANLDELEKALRRGFPDDGRVNAFHVLTRAGRREIEIRAGKKGPTSEVLTPLLAGGGGPGGLQKAIGAVQAMGGSNYNKQALIAAERLLGRKGLNPSQRLWLTQTLHNSLHRLGRKEEATRRLGAIFESASDPATALWSGGTIFRVRLAAKKYESAAKALEKIATTVKAATFNATNYAQLAQMRMEFFRGMKSGLDEEKAGKLLARLVETYPENAGYLAARARMLAGDGKYPEAYVFLEKAVERLTRVPEKLRLRPELARARASDRARLLRLMARIAAQDARLRKTFLKTAVERRKGEDPVLRPWTIAALSCLQAAGDDAARLKLLQSLAAAEPDDPQWKRQLAGACLAGGKLAEARKALEQVLAAEPDDAAVAMKLHDLCVRLKDQKAAKVYRDKFLDVLALQPNRLQQFAQHWRYYRPDRREWALDAWKRLRKSPSYARNGYASYMAGVIAQQLGRNKEAVDLHFAVLAAPQPTYAASSVSCLQNLWSLQLLKADIEKRVEKILARDAGGARGVQLRIMQYQLENMRGRRKSAIARLKQAAQIKLSAAAYSSAAYTLISTMANAGMHAEAEEYARKAGGHLPSSARRQLLRNAAQNLSHRDRSRAKKLFRELLKHRDSQTSYDYGQLVQILINDNDLAGAEIELRKMDIKTASYNVWNAWNSVINGYRNKRKYRRGALLAMELLERHTEQPNFYSHCGSTCFQVITEAINNRSLSKQTRKKIADIVLVAAKRHFSAEGGGGRPANIYYYNYWYSNNWASVDKLGLRSGLDALAASAGKSGNLAAVLRAGHYFNNRGKRDEAKKIYLHALKLPGADRKQIVPSLFHIFSSYGNKEEKALALEYLEELLKTRQYNHASYYQQKVRLLYELGRKKQARAACREVLKRPDVLRQGPGWLQNIARTCEAQKDWVTAAELWELALRTVKAYYRVYYRRNVDYYTLSTYYGGAARCYAKAGKGELALACYLRGLSLIPRNNQHYYRQFLNQAMNTFLKGRALDDAVAGYEKAVKDSGGVEKPQLRLAFAEAYRKAGKTEKMLHNLEVAANLLPKDMKLRKQVIDGYKKLGKKEAVVRAYLDWAKVDRQNIQIYQQLGDHYVSMGKQEDAMIAWATMAEVRPRESEGYHAYARVLLRYGKHKQAAVALRKAIRYRPTRHDIANELAGVYRKLKQGAKIWPLWTSGEKACRQAMKDFAEDPLPWLDLVRFLKAQGRKEDAKAMCSQIIKKPWKRFKWVTVRTAQQLQRGL